MLLETIRFMMILNIYERVNDGFPEIALSRASTHRDRVVELLGPGDGGYAVRLQHALHPKTSNGQLMKLAISS